MILHPPYRTLSRYAAGDLAPPKRDRVAAHLAACADCRASLAGRRALADALRDDPAPELAADAFDRIVARRAAGDRVILPVDARPSAEPGDLRIADAEITARPRPRRRLTAILALAAAAVAAVFLAVRAPEAGAEDSELRVLTAAPCPGGEVAVEYRATPRLAGEERLVLRARIFTAEPFMAPRHAVLGELRRDGDRDFRGTFHLPDSVVYAVLAVEDAAGRRVDLDRAGWTVRAHGADGRPLLAALRAEDDFRSEWNTALGVETAREMTELYPDSIAAWMRLHARETMMAGRETADSLRARHRERVRAFDRALAAAPSPSPTEMTLVAFYASQLDDTATERRWVERLLREHPRSPAAVQRRVFAVAEETRGNRAAMLAGMERLWDEVGAAAPQLPFSGFMLAQQAGDGDAVLRWGTRFLAGDPASRPWVTRTIAGVPALRDTAIVLLRAHLREIDAGRGGERQLGHTTDEHRANMLRFRGIFLGEMGKALLAAGRTGAALDTLARAIESSWNVDLMRTLADTRLAAGDTAGALPLLARVAADPTAGADFADSARTRLGGRFDAAAWARETEAGRRELRAHVAAREIRRPLLGSVRLRRPDGTDEAFRPESDEPTLVAFWSRYCPPSVMQMEELRRIARELTGRGVRVVTVTEEQPSPELTAHLRQQRYAFPVLLDSDGDARRAFASRGTPQYVLLDPAGRIRFESHVPDDLIRQVAYLQQQGGGVAGR